MSIGSYGQSINTIQIQWKKASTQRLKKQNNCIRHANK